MFIKYIVILISFTCIFSLPGRVSDNFYLIDQHADAAPQHLKQSIPALVNYLVKPAQNDIQKVRAIFRWISQNIDYDVDSFLEQRLISEDPQQVIEHGFAVCGGYAQLFKRMCAEISIPCEIIPGWSKGYIEQLTGQPNHAWNAVKIDNRWFLLDVTWGSGYINDAHSYIKSFQEHYFFTDPQLLIYDHLPQNKKWQLLNTPITRAEFEDLILLRPHFFKTGLSLLSHKESNIPISDELIIEMGAPAGTYINAELVKDKHVLEDHFVLSQRLAKAYFINVHFPDQGDYILRVYSRLANQKVYYWACDYNVHVTNNINRDPFAKQFSSFYDLDSFIFYPKDLILDSRNNQPFKILVEHALEVSLLVNEKNIIPFKRSGNIYTTNIKPASGPLRIMAKTDTTNQYQFLLEYQVK